MLEFQRTQRAFAAHLRDPAANAPPSDIEDRRLQIYRDLFYNNIENFLTGAFPVLRALSSDAVWHARARDFYARHSCHAPQFYKIAEEFLRYLDETRGDHPDDPPFLRDLCHYEWVELALQVSDVKLSPELADPNGDLLNGRPLPSPLAWTLSYAWPVHRLGPAYQPTAVPEQPTYLIVHRDRADDVRFMDVNAVTARLMQLFEENPDLGGRDALRRIAGELSHPEPDAVIEQGTAILHDLRARDIVLGTRR